MQIDVALITNGAGTFDQALQCLAEQTVRRPVTVIRDRPWLAAQDDANAAGEREWYLRVDDDMWLHPHAVAFYEQRLELLADADDFATLCMFWCYLYQPWDRQIVPSIKVYNREASRRIGFRAGRNGSIHDQDNQFLTDAPRWGYHVLSDTSVVGLHVLRSADDQARYQRLWIAETPTLPVHKPIVTTALSPAEQRGGLNRLARLNQERGTTFAAFLEQNK